LIKLARTRIKDQETKITNLTNEAALLKKREGGVGRVIEGKKVRIGGAKRRLLISNLF